MPGFRGDRRDDDATERPDEQRLVQRLRQNAFHGHLALGGHIQHGQCHRGENRLLHDQNRSDQRGISENVCGNRQADIVRVEVERVECADGRVRGLHVEEQLIEDQEHQSDQHG